MSRAAREARWTHVNDYQLMIKGKTLFLHILPEQ